MSVAPAASISVVDVAGVDARRSCDGPMAGRERTPCAEDGRVTGTTTPGAPVAVLASRSIGMIRWKKPGAFVRQAPCRGAGHEAVRHREIDIEDATLEHVPGP